MKLLLVLVAFFLGLADSGAWAFPQYHDISDTAAAQAEARQRNLPLAYLGGFPEDIANGAPDPGSVADLTQMALATLQGRVVVIFFDGHNMAPVPALIHAQYHIPDDGPLEGGAAWIRPKVVFSNADITKVLGRVSYTEMKTDRDIPLNSALQIIHNDPTALVSAPAAAPSAQASSTDSVDNALSVVSWMYGNALYLAIGLILVLAIVILALAKSRPQ